MRAVRLFIAELRSELLGAELARLEAEGSALWTQDRGRNTAADTSNRQQDSLIEEGQNRRRSSANWRTRPGGAERRPRPGDVPKVLFGTPSRIPDWTRSPASTNSPPCRFGSRRAPGGGNRSGTLTPRRPRPSAARRTSDANAMASPMNSANGATRTSNLPVEQVDVRSWFVRRTGADAGGTSVRGRTPRCVRRTL